jgi:phospholipase D1/2
VDLVALKMGIEDAGGSLIRAIEALRSEGRSLVPFEPPELTWAEDAVLGENQLLDPERPASRRRALQRGLSRLFSTVRGGR